MRTDDWRRYVGPAAFLLAVTVAVVLIRAGMNAGSSTAGRTTTASQVTAHKPVAKRFFTVRAGDTFSTISRKTHVPAATIAKLNPKASSTSLFIGERVRIR